jgi:hypothetical protein
MLMWRCYRLTLVLFLQIFNLCLSEFVEKHFDFLTFSQMWPITECEMWQSKGISNGCFLPQESKFFLNFFFKDPGFPFGLLEAESTTLDLFDAVSQTKWC